MVTTFETFLQPQSNVPKTYKIANSYYCVINL